MTSSRYSKHPQCPELPDHQAQQGLQVRVSSAYQSGLKYDQTYRGRSYINKFVGFRRAKIDEYRQTVQTIEISVLGRMNFGYFSRFPEQMLLFAEVTLEL